MYDKLRPHFRRPSTIGILILVVAGTLLAAVAILAVFLYTFKEQSGRVLDLVSSDCP